MKVLVLGVLAVAAVVMMVTVSRGAAPATGAAALTGPGGVPRVKLWEHAPGAVSTGQDTDVDPMEPRMDVYLPPEDKATGAAVMVLPGGGYTHLSVVNEGSSVAKMLVSHNIAAFVVMYRHAPRYHYPLPLLDAQRALRLVRSKAAEYHLDANRMGVMGFSAGGHLAASVATMYDSGPKPERPDVVDAVSARSDFAVLMYPVINMTDEMVVHKGSRTALTQDNKELFALLSPEQHVTKETPPVFLVHGTNDRTVPVRNSLLMYEACLKAGVPAELHLFANGPHGFGLAPNDAQLKVWPELLMGWLTREKVIAK